MKKSFKVNPSSTSIKINNFKKKNKPKKRKVKRVIHVLNKVYSFFVFYVQF